MKVSAKYGKQANTVERIFGLENATTTLIRLRMIWRYSKRSCNFLLIETLDHACLLHRIETEVGKVTIKSNGDEALSDEFLLKSNGDEALNDVFSRKSNGDEAFNAKKKL